jgi:hypothetical protein
MQHSAQLLSLSLYFPMFFVSYVAHAVDEIETLSMRVYEFPGGRFSMLR